MKTIISVKVITNAKLDEIVGLMDDGTLKIRIKAKPVQGKANSYLRKYLSKRLGIHSGDIEIISGIYSRKKMIKIENVSKKVILEKLNLIYVEP